MDLDHDGNVDLLSGSWPGELFLFRGGAGRTFAPPEMLKDKDGGIINIGGGIVEQADGSILITGNGEFREVDGKMVVTYHGTTIACSDEKPVSVTGTASAVHAVDWDGDGDPDLLVGDIYGKVHVIPNEGTPTGPAFGAPMRLLVGMLPLEVGGDAGPFTADWDGDGDLDLLVGCADGSVQLFRQVGKAGGWPVLGPPEELVAPGEAHYDAQAPAVPTRGIRAKVCAADWNGDGRLDLLVGDFATMKPDLPAPTPEEAAVQARLRAELDEIQERYSALANRLYGGKIDDPDERARVSAEFTEVSERVRQLHAQLPPEYEDHGWVWLFLRRSADS